MQNIQKKYKIIITQIFQQFDFFLDQIKSIFSQNKIKFISTQIEFKHVNRIFNKNFFDNYQQLQYTVRTSKSTSQLSQSLEQYPPKNQLGQQVNKFLNQIKLGNFQHDKDTNVSAFICALGPRLLLHGKIYAYYQGIYFQSFFNKKNLFFGRTKLFIPRKQVMGFNTRQVFGFIPDIIDIETIKGTLVFHCLGWRSYSFDLLNQIYFPQTQIQQQLYQRQQFHNFQIKQLPKDYKIYLEPFQQQVSIINFQNSSLPIFFRRYLSDDIFQYQGKQYQNYKVFNLQDVEAIDPKSTPITPEAPKYFQYKNILCSQSLPQKSERLVSYKKKIPKIPFLSSGGEGLCEEKQIFFWVSSQILILENRVKIMGFSLTEGMEVCMKRVYEQKGNNLCQTTTAKVLFASQSTTNSLLRRPTLSNLRSTCSKVNQFIQKYEKLMNRKYNNKKKQNNINNINQLEQLKINIQQIIKQNLLLKKKLIYQTIIFIIFYIISIIAIGSYPL